MSERIYWVIREGTTRGQGWYWSGAGWVESRRAADPYYSIGLLDEVRAARFGGRWVRVRVRARKVDVAAIKAEARREALHEAAGMVRETRDACRELGKGQAAYVLDEMLENFDEKIAEVPT